MDEQKSKGLEVTMRRPKQILQLNLRQDKAGGKREENDSLVVAAP